MKELKFKLGDKLFIEEYIIEDNNKHNSNTMYHCEIVGVDENDMAHMPYLVRVYNYGKEHKRTDHPEFCSKIIQDYYKEEVKYFYETWVGEGHLLISEGLTFSLGDKVVCAYEGEHKIGYIVGLDYESPGYNYMVRIFLNDNNVRFYADGVTDKVKVIKGYKEEVKSFEEIWINEKDMLLLEENSYRIGVKA